MPTRFRPRLEPVEPRLTPAFPTYMAPGAVLLPDEAGGGLFRVVAPYDGTDLGDVTPFPDWPAATVRTATIPNRYPLKTDLIVGAGPGGAPRVRVFDGLTGQVRLDFLAFEESFRGGVYVASLDRGYDGLADIVVGAGEGGSPRVRVFDGRFGYPIGDFMAFEDSFRGGVRVAAGDLSGDSLGEIVVGAGPGGAPRVSIFEWRGYNIGADAPPELATFFAYDPAFRGGVSVGVVEENYTVLPTTGVTFGRHPSVVTAPGLGGGPHVRVFDGVTGAETASFLVGDAADRGGLSLTDTRGDFLAPGVVAAFATPAGPSFVGVALDGDPVVWVRPPRTGSAHQLVTSVDLAARIVTFDGGGSVVVRPDTVLRLDYRPVTLDAFAAGYGVVTLLGPDGQLLALDGFSPPPPIIDPPSVQPINDYFG